MYINAYYKAAQHDYTDEEGPHDVVFHEEITSAMWCDILLLDLVKDLFVKSPEFTGVVGLVKWSRGCICVVNIGVHVSSLYLLSLCCLYLVADSRRWLGCIFH